MLGEILGSVGSGIAQGAFASHSARQQMEFQERMASTQYQRAADDLQKAGLNRILALGSPAAAPSGASASINPPDLGASYREASSAKSAIALQQKQQELLDAQIAKTGAEAENIRADTANKPFQGQSLISGIESNQAGIGLTTANIDRIKQEIPKIVAETRLVNANAGEAEFKKALYEKLAPLLKEVLDGLLPSSAKGSAGLLDQSRGAITELIEKLFPIKDSDSYKSKFAYPKR